MTNITIRSLERDDQARRLIAEIAEDTTEHERRRLDNAFGMISDLRKKIIVLEDKLNDLQ
jgi:hypothetical protein